MEETVKKYITSLLTSAPGGVQMYQLERDYKNTIGEPIPYMKLGYRSLEFFLKSIPDTVLVCGSGREAVIVPVIKEKSAHINQMVAKQKTPKGKRGFSLPRQFLVQQQSQNITKKIHYPNRKPEVPSSSTPQATRMSFPQVTASSISQVPTSNTPKATSSSTSQVEVKVPKNTTVTEFFESVANNITDDRKKPEIKIKTMGTLKVSNVDKEVTESQINGNIEPNTSSSLTTASKLMRVKMNSRAKTQLSSNLRQQYSPYQNVAERDVSNNNKFVFGITKKGVSANSSSDFDSSSTSLSGERVPLYVQNNLKTLISYHPDGVWCAQLPTLYRRMFNKELNYEEFGFRSLIELCSSLPTIFHYARPSKDDFRLYDRSKALPENAEKKFTIASYSADDDSENNALPAIDWEDLCKYVPKDIFQPGCDIPREFVPETTKEDDMFDVIAAEIYDISKFWVFFDNGILDNLMNEMQDFYKVYHQKYEMPEQFLTEGVYCVSIIFHEYHRGLIVDVLPEDEGWIRVLYIDYGTVEKTSTKGVCFLHENFATVKAQAIRCRLANVVPAMEGAPWSLESTTYLKKIVRNKSLKATVIKINWEDQYLDIYLEDMSDPHNPFYINDRLVQEGYAQNPDKERKKYKVDSVFKCKVKQIHLFPTFTELENGYAPSSTEMAVYEQCCIPIHFAYPQYFEIDNSKEKLRVATTDSNFQQNIRQRRENQVYFFDIAKLKPQSYNFEYFGDLEDEMREFVGHPRCDESSQTDCCDDENPENIDKSVELISTQLEIKEFAEKLKNDCLLAQDIMTDLEKIYNCDVSENLKQELNFDPSEGFWSLNDGTECKNNEESLRDSPRVVEELIDLDLEDYLSIPDRHSSMKSNCDTNDSFETDSIDNVANASDEGISERTLKSTNPFLQDLQIDFSDSGSAVKSVTLNKNNPFLTYQPPKESEKTDSMTALIERLKLKSWSTEDSRSDSVKSLDVQSSHSDAAQSVDNGLDNTVDTVKDMSISSSTSEEQSKTLQQPVAQYSYPQNISTGANYYGYGGYLQQPNMYPQYHMYRPPLYHESAYALARQYQQQTNYPQGFPYMSGYQAPVIPTSHFPSQRMPSSTWVRPPPGFAPNSNIYQVNSVSHTMLSSNLNTDSDSANDFYEMYNAYLRSTFNIKKVGDS